MSTTDCILNISMIYTIYKSTNKITGHCYIGFDKHWPNRKYGHKSRAKKQNNNYKFYNAINKYGWENFDWEIIYQSLDFEHTYKIMESYFINYYDTYNNGYNMTKGGDGISGGRGGAPKGRIPWNKGKSGLQKHSDETRKKMSLVKKGISPKYNLQEQPRDPITGRFIRL